MTTFRETLPPLPPDAPARDRLVAHRGLPLRFPENTAPSLLAAVEAGAPLVELDARPTEDGLLVVLHDPSPERLTGEERPAVELTARELLSRPLRDAPGERLLLLDEALALLAHRVPLDVELKRPDAVDPTDLARRLLAALERAGSPRRLIVTSDDPVVLRELRARAPVLATGFVARSRDPRDPVATAIDAAAPVLVASRRRVSSVLVSRARERGLETWVYTVDDAEEARRLIDLGVARLFTDDLPALRAAIGDARGEDDPRGVPGGGPLLVALDVGSSTTKAALVDPGVGIVARAAEPTPVTRPAPGRVEHDPEETLAAVRRVLAAVAARAEGRVPRAAAVTGQRSTVLWAAPGGLEPVTPAVSWRDRRAEGLAAALRPRAAELEEIAGLPPAPAWSGLLGRVLRDEVPLPGGALLVPLVPWVAARLAGDVPAPDPTFANRTFLLDRRRDGWSPTLLEALGLPAEALPPLRPTLAGRGWLPWPGTDAGVPLTVLVGDQQAAYVGLAGPAARRTVLNVGTAGFAMRTLSPHEPPPPGSRRAPLWTAASRRGPELVELVVHEEPTGSPPLPREPADAARDTALRLALGDPLPARFAAGLARAAGMLRGPRETSVAVAGGILASPHLLALLATSTDLAVVRAREPEVTLLGAARLAAVAARVPWSVPPGGGLLLPGNE